jgi:hypothetical protein
MLGCRIMLSVGNQCSLLNCVVYSKSVFTVELCYPQRISVRFQIVLSQVNQCSLPNCVVSSESIFATELCYSQ